MRLSVNYDSHYNREELGCCQSRNRHHANFKDPRKLMGGGIGVKSEDDEDEAEKNQGKKKRRRWRGKRGDICRVLK